MLLAALILALAGCSSGQVDEARVDQRRDAEETPQMAVQQATRIAQRYFPASPEASPPVPLAPVVGLLAVTLATNPDGSPQGSYASLPADAGTAFATARLDDGSAGQAITAIWTDAFGNEFGRSEQELAASAAVQWVALPVGLSPGLAPGQYAVYLFADDNRIGSLAFGVTAPGTAPQLYPDLPANPQVPAAAPTSPSGAPTVAPANGNRGGQG
ncbi:MAG: hypothetical protein AVDCRST_MAG59-5211 [uncultured Thermomicrobiales bacterium]|uniref:Uncharacterized protein n=1 Tax=uncultured Thermomicrobiales bacterium TaxID=1645740 RepID=A0A6J4VSF6_9BACT|nr:MAG: hypothetical protein AVDCRST_MAG59-5211 [uncultured Thermomicrobiales bacterium]